MLRRTNGQGLFFFFQLYVRACVRVGTERGERGLGERVLPNRVNGTFFPKPNQKS